MASIGKSALAHATSIVWGSLQVIVWVSPSKGLGRGDNSCLSHSVLISHLGQLTSSVLVSAVASEVSLLNLICIFIEVFPILLKFAHPDERRARTRSRGELNLQKAKSNLGGLLELSRSGMCYHT